MATRLKTGRHMIVASYYFPPDHSIGARRWDQLCRFAANAGWTVDVIACAPRGTPAAVQVHSENVVVHYVPQPRIRRSEFEAWLFARMRGPLARWKSRHSGGGRGGAMLRSDGPEPTVAARRGWELSSPRGWMRIHWVLADAAWSRAWGKGAAQVIRRLVAERDTGVIISSCPPHPAHVPVAQAARDLGVPFVMDMRDPWSLVEEVPEHVDTPLLYKFAHRMEQWCISVASLVIANTAPAMRSLVAKYPHESGKMIAVLNGADDEEVPVSQLTGPFVIAYAGTIYTDRDPTNLLRGVAKFVRAQAVAPTDFRVKFMGDFATDGSCAIPRIAKEEGISDYVELHPRRPRAEALVFLAQAAVLVIFPGFNSVSILAKVFECVLFRAWILSLSPPGSAMEELLAGTDARVVPPADTDAIAGAIGEWYHAFQSGVRPEAIGAGGRFSRAREAEKLLAALDLLVGPEFGVVGLRSVASMQQRGRSHVTDARG